MGTTRRDFLKGLMATTAAVVLPVRAVQDAFEPEAVLEEVFSHFYYGKTRCFSHMVASGRYFYWTSQDGEIEAGEGIYQSATALTRQSADQNL